MNCPVCNHSNPQIAIESQDFSLTQTSFTILHCTHCSVRFTSPLPNQDEIGQYYQFEAYISHTDVKEGWMNRLYHFVRARTLTQKTNWIQSLFTGHKGHLLDIGAGTGDFLLTAKQNGWNTIGVEPSEKAKGIAIGKGIKFSNSTNELESNSFDVITMWHVLEHVPNLDLQIKELKRLIKPNGTIIIAVPNFKSYDAKYYGKFWAAFDVPIHFWHFSKTAIKLLFEKENVKLEKVLPMKFDSFYVSLLSEKYKNGKMNFVKAIWIGLLSNIKANRSSEHSSHIYVLKNNEKAI